MLLKLEIEYVTEITDDGDELLFAMHCPVKSYHVHKQDVVLGLSTLLLVQEVRQRTNMREKHCRCSSANSETPLNKYKRKRQHESSSHHCPAAALTSITATQPVHV